MRLTKTIREEILKKLLARKFEAREKSLDDAKTKLAEDVLKAMLKPKEREWLASAPKGSIVYDKSIPVHFGGQYARLQLPAELYPSSLGRVFLEPRLRFAADHPYTRRFEEIFAEVSRTREEKRAAKAEAWAALQSATTAKRLIKAWPEIAPFIPESEKAVTALAVRREALNETFELPVKAVK